jgi:hypothetical protein
MPARAPRAAQTSGFVDIPLLAVVFPLHADDTEQ